MPASWSPTQAASDVKALRYALKSFFREIRSGEVLILLSAVALAVAALTAVGFLTDRISKSVARQANEVLAADLRLRSPDPIPELWRDIAADNELATAETQTFPSVVFAGDESSLATIKGVSDSYPLRGRVRVAAQLFGADREVDTVPAPGTVWADAALLARLGAAVGDSVSVGEVDLAVDAVLTYRPDQSIGFASLAPSIMINLADMPGTGLITEGSRVSYALLVAGDDESAVDAFYETVEADLPESVRVRNREDSSERAGNAADRAQRFLSLTAVISVLLSAVRHRDVRAPLCPAAHGYRRFDEGVGRESTVHCCGGGDPTRAAGACRCRRRQRRRVCSRVRGDRNTCGSVCERSARSRRGARVVRDRGGTNSADWLCAAVDPAAAQHAAAASAAPRRHTAATISFAGRGNITRCRRLVAVSHDWRCAASGDHSRRYVRDFRGALRCRTRSGDAYRAQSRRHRHRLALWTCERPRVADGTVRYRW